MPDIRNQLQEFVDSPNETLDAEYKSWLDLTRDNEARADFARHLCALANHGGGVVVLGFADDMSVAGANPYPHVSYDRDLISSIVKRYLEPTFQCSVHVVKSALGNEHPIVVVPSHGAAPICARASGPERNGRPQGILQGTHYIRKIGPESAPVLTSAEWAPLIRRCAMHERTAILGAIDVALRGVPASVSEPLPLQKWHEAARAIFIKDLEAANALPHLRNGFYQFSYSVDRSDGQILSPADLTRILREINSEVTDLVRTGWSMFYPFTRPEIAPYHTTDAAAGIGDADFLQTTLLRDSEGSRGRFSDMWRVAGDGKATVLRNYWEDDSEMAKAVGLNVGSWFSPNMMVRALAELVRHARSMAERFDTPTAVSFRCEWSGLLNRRIAHPSALWRGNYVSRTDGRVVSGSWPLTALAGNWPEIVAELGAPVVRLFTSEFILTDQWVRGQAPTWLR